MKRGHPQHPKRQQQRNTPGPRSYSSGDRDHCSPLSLSALNFWWTKQAPSEPFDLYSAIEITVPIYFNQWQRLDTYTSGTSTYSQDRLVPVSTNLYPQRLTRVINYIPAYQTKTRQRFITLIIADPDQCQDKCCDKKMYYSSRELPNTLRKHLFIMLVKLKVKGKTEYLRPLASTW